MYQVGSDSSDENDQIYTTLVGSSQSGRMCDAPLNVSMLPIDLMSNSRGNTMYM